MVSTRPPSLQSRGLPPSQVNHRDHFELFQLHLLQFSSKLLLFLPKLCSFQKLSVFCFYALLLAYNILIYQRDFSLSGSSVLLTRAFPVLFQKSQGLHKLNLSTQLIPLLAVKFVHA